ncbi:MAG TPA: hypothetical protein VM534_09945 [Thermoanaerobaculia bacterium]|nr:hypothetical protein [Thermoanaerobaculia bacterium]
MRSTSVVFLAVAFLFLVLPLFADEVLEADLAARQADQAHRAAQQEVRQSEQQIARLERDIQQLERDLQQAQQQSSSGEQPAEPEPTPAQIDEQIRALQEDLRRLTSIINKLIGDHELSADEQELLQRIIGSSIPVKAELLEILRELRAQWERKLVELRQDRAQAQRNQRAQKPERKKEPATDPASLQQELEQKHRELEEATRQLELDRAAAQDALRNKQIADLEAERARARRNLEQLERKIRDKAEEVRRAAERLDQERQAAEAGSEAAQNMARVLSWTREIVTRLATFLAGDVGEALADLATTQLDFGARILENLDRLLPQIEGLTKNPDGTYSFNQAGQILIHRLVDALNHFIRAQRELESLVRAYQQEQQRIQNLDQQIASAKQG